LGEGKLGKLTPDGIKLSFCWIGLGAFCNTGGITIYGEKYPTHVDEMKKKKRKKKKTQKVVIGLD
jgi:hypothetical protein